jgi:hypothetical protein
LHFVLLEQRSCSQIKFLYVEYIPPCNENISSPYQSYPSHPSSDT